MSKFWVFWTALLLFSYPAKADSRVHIAVVDSGIIVTDKVYPYLCDGPHLDFTNTGVQTDAEGHGSMVTDIITNGLDPKEFCIQVLKWVDRDSNYPKVVAKAVQAAVQFRAQIINLSVSGVAGPDKEEREAITLAISKGITVVIAAGNNRLNLSDACRAYPACYSIQNELFHVVGDYLLGYRAPYSNYGGPVTDTEDGRYSFNDRDWKGTSVAAAKVTNRIAKQHAYLKARQ